MLGVKRMKSQMEVKWGSHPNLREGLLRKRMEEVRKTWSCCRLKEPREIPLASLFWIRELPPEQLSSLRVEKSPRTRLLDSCEHLDDH